MQSSSGSWRSPSGWRGRPVEGDVALTRAESDAADTSAGPIASRVAIERARVALLAGEIELADAAEATVSAIDELERARDWRGLGRAQLGLASIHAVACDFRSQETAAALAVAHYADAGFSPAAAYASQASALYYGPLPVAAAVRRCTELLESSPDRMTEANMTAVLGALHGLRGEVAQARALLDRARSAYDDLGHRSVLETILAPLAVDVERLWQEVPRRPLAICRASFEALAVTGDRAFASTRAIHLAELLLDLGRAEEAEHFVRIAEQQVIRSDVLVQFLRRSQRARLLSREGRHDDAESLAREAVAISSLTDALLDRTRTHTALAGGARRRGCSGRGEARDGRGGALVRREGPQREREPLGLPFAHLTQPPPPPPSLGMCRFRMAHLLSCAHGRAEPKRPGHGPLTGR